MRRRSRTSYTEALRQAATVVAVLTIVSTALQTTGVDLKQAIAGAIGPLAGFFAGWLLFELTERRRVRMASQALRDALVSELENAEVLLSTLVGKYAHLAQTPDDVANTAREIRWFVATGRQRASGTGLELTGAIAEGFDTLSDAQVVALFALTGAKETAGTKLILPVVDAVLAGRTPGFSGPEIQTLSTV